MASNLNRAGLITESSTLFPDNNTQEISPQDLRDWIADGVTSFVTQKDKSTLENAIYENDSTPLAAGATVDLSTADGNFIHITGAATITSFGVLPAGARFVLVFDGICLLTYNATSLIIPGSANKTTAAGDACLIISEGSGNWRIVAYFPISGSGGAGITALTGDVTASGSGSVAATIANGAVDIPMLSATGTPSATTFLRGDNTWETPAGGGSGTVTSVGLTMPSAFNVSTPNPITTAGTLAVTGAGLDSQYIRGDGTLANFPTSTGGGSSISYYLNGSITQLTIGGVTYYQMSKTPVFGSGTNFTRTSAAGNGYIASFITNAGDPNILSVPGGNFNLEFYFNASSGGGSPQFYGEVYKYDGATLTLIASGSVNPEGITSGTTVDQYFTSISVPTTALALTDRLAVRIYVIPSGRNITLHTEDNNLCQVITTISTGLTALNGLTAQVQTFATGTSGTDFNISSVTNTHTFNIPDASASNRGLITTGAQTLAGIKTLGNGASAGEIRLLEPFGSGSNYVAIKAQAMSSNYDLILPASAGTVGNFLQYGTGGNLSWGNPNPYGFFKSLKILGLGTGVNSTTITLSNSLYIPAGTFVAGDMVTIYARFYKSSASLVRNYTNYIYVNTVNSVVSGSPILLATALAGAAQVNGELIRELSVLSSGVSGQSIIKNTTTPNTDWSNYVLSSAQLSILTIDWSVDQYLIHAMNQSATTVTEFGYSYGLSITGR